MKTLITTGIGIVFGGALLAQSALAQVEPPEDVHPLLDSKFILSLGAFIPEKEFKLRANGSSVGDYIDFDEAFKYSDSQTTFSGSFTWRYGKKWSLWLEAWEVDSAGGSILTEDYDWNDLIFREGTFAEAGVDLSVIRVFTGRELWTGPNYETGLGVGLHWLEIGAYIQGEIKVNEDTTEFQRGDAKAELPLPNIGGWWIWSMSPRWAASARIDWLSASIDRYSGDLWNGQVGIHFQATRNLGLSLNAAYFELDGRIKEDRWRGQVEVKQYGPKVSLYFTF